MSIIEYTRRAICKDCKFYEVKRFKDFLSYQGWCNLLKMPTREKIEFAVIGNTNLISYGKQN